MCSASGFLSFMNGYTVFLGPIAGIMVTDVSIASTLEQLILSANINSIGSSIGLMSMFLRCIVLTADTGTHTVSCVISLDVFCMSLFPSVQNWRALVSLLLTIPLTLPGLINSINSKIGIGNATHLFDIAYMLGVRLKF